MKIKRQRDERIKENIKKGTDIEGKEKTIKNQQNI